MFTNATNKFWSLVMTGLADVNGFGFKICIQVCMWLGFRSLSLHKIKCRRDFFKKRTKTYLKILVRNSDPTGAKFAVSQARTYSKPTFFSSVKSLIQQYETGCHTFH